MYIYKPPLKPLGPIFPKYLRSFRGAGPNWTSLMTKGTSFAIDRSNLYPYIIIIYYYKCLFPFHPSTMVEPTDHQLRTWCSSINHG